MPRYVLSITEMSSLPGNMPLYEDIVGAMRPAANAYGTWVGPGPRVVRRTDVTSLRGYETVVTWPIDAPSEAAVGRVLYFVRQRLRESNGGLPSDWTDGSYMPYAEAVNGPASFWESGDATNTRTKNIARWGTERIVLPEENASGPDAVQRRDPTAAELAEEAARRYREQVKAMAWTFVPIAIVGVGLYLLVTAGPSWLQKPARKNPRGRRRLKSDDSWLAAGLLFLPP